MTRPGNGSTEERVASALAWLKRRGTKTNRLGMARYGIRSEKVFGVSVADTRSLAKRFGRDPDLAAALWESGWLEARLLAAFVERPSSVTPAQMERWCRDFDNWALCDGVCIHLFRRTPHAWGKVARWTHRRDEFVKRAGFALLATLAVHDARAGDDRFENGLRLIEAGAADDRNFVKKAVSWALRAIGKRNAALRTSAVGLARRLSASPRPSTRWVGKDALRELTRL